MPEDALDAQFDRLRRELRQDIQASAAELRQDFRQDIQASAAELRQDFRQDIQASAAETRRHMDVVAEGLRSAIRAIAERLRALDQKVECFRDEVRQEFAKVDRHFDLLEEGIALWSDARGSGPAPVALRRSETCRSRPGRPERTRCWPSGRCRPGPSGIGR